MPRFRFANLISFNTCTLYIVQHIYCTYHYRILSHLSVLEKLSMYIVYCICLSLWFHLSSISVAMKWMHHLIHTVKKWIIFYLRFVKLWLMKDHSKLLITKKYLADFFSTVLFDSSLRHLLYPSASSEDGFSVVKTMHIVSYFSTCRPCAEYIYS